jgi:hypothetical protein
MSEESEFPLSARTKILGELVSALRKLQTVEVVRGRRRDHQEALVELAAAIGRLRFYAEVPRKGRP